MPANLDGCNPPHLDKRPKQPHLRHLLNLPLHLARLYPLSYNLSCRAHLGHLAPKMQDAETVAATADAEDEVAAEVEADQPE